MSERYHEVRRDRDHYREHCAELEADNKRLTAKLIDAEEAYSVTKDAYFELEGTLSAFACLAEASAAQLGLLDEWREARTLVGLDQFDPEPAR